MSDRAHIQRRLSDFAHRLSELQAELECLALEVGTEPVSPTVSGEWEALSGAARSSSAVGSPLTTRGVSSGAPRPSDNIREQSARETGRFFVRCLSGDRRGLSGRERVALANRLYVVVRDFAGNTYTEPVKVVEKVADLKRLVNSPTSKEDCGSSIFAGFASQWEARIAVREAGLSWP